jgi:signal transduction histidine kinase/CheY-like chemotaxis protein
MVLDQLIIRYDLRNFALSVCFVLSIVVASAVGGWRAGLLATVLGMAVHLFAFVEPRYTPKLPDQRELLRILAYCVAGGAITVLSEALQRAWDRVRDRQRQLEEEAARKNEFLATLAHELRNPLAPIRNGLELLRLESPLSPTAAECLAMMERQLEHTVRLVDDLLDVSRISRGKIELRTQPIDVADVIHHAVETSRSLIDEAGHTFIVDLPSTRHIVNGDLTRLAQVVSNLLNNAAKFTPSGGQITLRAEATAGQAIIRVRDNGIGIPPDVLPRVFEMFAQAPGSMPQSRGGLGIGLSLSRALVELHGGRIDVRSEGAGHGAEFIVQLPVLPASATDETRSPTETVVARTALNILVVDDNRDGARTLAKVLEILGNDVAVAHDGHTALATAEERRPALILLDIGLPDLDGYEVCRRLRQKPWCERVHVYAITGWGQEDDRRRSHAAGFNGHFVKPVAPHAIIDLVSRLAAGETSQQTAPAAVNVDQGSRA